MVAEAPARILVIDDERMIGEMVRDMLAQHEVEAFLRPSEALIRAEQAPFDVVLCDLLMPEMSGVDVFEVLARRRPALARNFILMTGSASAPSVREFLHARHVVLLQNPFRVAELERCVEDAMRQTRVRPKAEIPRGPAQ